MNATQAQGEVYVTAFKALPWPEQEYVLAAITRDRRLRRLLENLSDRAVIAEEREQPSRPLRDYVITVEIEHLKEGPYLGTSPDLPGLIVQADTSEEVIQLAPQLAHELIDSLLREGDPLPTTLREVAKIDPDELTR